MDTAAQEVLPPLWLLLPHALSGVLAMAAGALALLCSKGGRAHRAAGWTFASSMAILAVTAIPLNFYQANYGLLSLVFLSSYLTFSGLRLRRNKQLFALDINAAVAVIIASMLIAFDHPDLVSGSVFLATLAVIGRDFGLRNTLFAGRDWLPEHIWRMVGAFAATVTVFSVLNLAFLPEWARWLWAPAVAVPVVWLFSQRYCRR